MARAAARPPARPRRRRRRPTAQDLFSAWRLFFERLADAGPVVLVFEDMQWADAGPARLRRVPARVVAELPALRARARATRAGERRLAGRVAQRDHALRSSRSADEAMDAAARRIRARACPTSSHAEILARAEGVPLYAVETVRMLLDRGLLEREGDAYRPTGPIEELEVPETLHALLAARLDGLTAEERALVQDASVLGKTFTKQGVAALSGTDEAEIEPLLARPRPQGGAHPPGRRALAGARPVRVPPGPAQAGRLRDALEGRPQDTAPGGRRGTSQRPGRTSTRSSRWSPPTTSRPTGCCPRPRTPPSSSNRRGTRSPGPASARRRWPRPSRPPASSRRPRSSPTTRSRRRGSATGPDARPTAAETWRRRDASSSAPRSCTTAAGATREAALVQAELGNTEWQLHESEPALERLKGAYAVLVEGEPDEGFAARRGRTRAGPLLHGRLRGGPAHGRRRARGGGAALAAGDALPGAEHRRPGRRRRGAAGSRGMR